MLPRGSGPLKSNIILSICTQGNLPPQIKTLQPAANISLTRHTDGYNDSKGQCAWLAASDPLFGQIADAWMKIMLADFGTDHWYCNITYIIC